jgi:hypothetical protein
MEKDPNPMPELTLFPRLEKLGRCLGRLVSFLPAQAPDHMSNHYRGGAAMLDRELYDDPNQLEFDYDRNE